MRFRKNSFWFYELLIGVFLLDAASVFILICEPQMLIPMLLMSGLITVCLLPLIIEVILPLNWRDWDAD